MTDFVPPPTDPFQTGSGGFLLDRNGDGHPDDLAVRILLPGNSTQLDTEFWCALIDLAARLGLETTGLPDRLVLIAGEPLPSDCRGLLVLPDDSSTESAA
jgi:hypothetical protein